MLNWFSLLHYLNISHTIRSMKNHVFYSITPCCLFTSILEELSACIVSVKECLVLEWRWQALWNVGNHQLEREPRVQDRELLQNAGDISWHIVISQKIWIFISITVVEISDLAIMNILQKFLFALCVITLSHLLALQFMFFASV